MIEKKTKKEKGLSNNYFNLALCAVSLVVLIVFIYENGGLKNLSLTIRSVHVGWLIATVGCMIVYWLLDAVVLHMAIKPVHPSQHFSTSFRLTMIGQYFNNVTPFAAGGQPAQAYFLIKRKVPFGETMTALLTKFIVYQITLTFYCLATLILEFNYFMSEVKVLMVAVMVGFLVHTAVTAMLISVAFFKTGTIKTANFFIDVLGKLRLVKDPDSKREFVDNELESFHAQFKYMSKHKLHLLKMNMITVVQLTVYFLIGNVIYFAFHLDGASTLKLVAAQAFVLMIAAFIPVPGALVAAEGSFYIFFSLFFPHDKINAAIFLWRLMTFYLPIAVGLVFTLVEKRKCGNLPLEMSPVEDELAATGGEPVFREKEK